MIIRFDRHSADRHNKAMNRGSTALRAALNVKSHFHDSHAVAHHHRDVAVPHREGGGQEGAVGTGGRAKSGLLCCEIGEKLWWRWPYARVPVGQQLLKATRQYPLFLSLALAVLFAPRRVA